MNTKLKTTLITSVLICAIALASCSHSSNQGSNIDSQHQSNQLNESSQASDKNFNPNPAGLTDYKGIEDEFFKSVDKLDWPEGFDLPTEVNFDQDIQYQMGYGDTVASNLWQYAWEKEWLDSYQTDPDRAAKAIEELEKAFDMDYLSPQRADDATRRFLRDYIDRAKLGDPSGFEQDIRANPMQ